MVDFHKYILDAYKSLSEPDYSFVRAALAKGLYSEVGAEFNKLGFMVEDDTEPNTDVCRTLILSKDNIQACIKLSFVGPFAAVFLLSADVSSIKEISHLLDARGFQVVSKDTLAQPYDISLLDMDAAPTLYNALFSSDVMPV